MCESIFDGWTVLDVIDDGIMVIDTKGRMIRSNRVLRSLFGAAPDTELPGDVVKTLEAIVHPVDREELLSSLDHALKGELPLSVRFRIASDREGWYFAMLSFTPLDDPLILCSLKNITEVVDAGIRLNEEIAVSEGMIRALPGIFFMFDEEGNFVRWNLNSEVVGGYSPEEMLSCKPLDLVSRKDRSRVKRTIREIFRTGRGKVEAEFIGKDGGLMSVEFCGTSVEIEGKRYLIGTGRDISSKQRTEKELEQANMELKRSKRELEQMIYVTSHDLRSPLVNIQGFSEEIVFSTKDLETLVEQAESLDGLREKAEPIIHKDLPEFNGYIHSSVVKIDSLISGLLKIFRIGRTPLELKELDMDALIGEIVSNVSYRLKEYDIDLELERLPPCVGDAVLIDQLFSNLIDNAIKYRDRERKTVIRVSGSVEAGVSEYIVEDNGIGIEEKDRRSIFEIFRKIGSKDIPGEGLGLAIVSRIVDHHQGRIWVGSEVGKGSRFHVSLPEKFISPPEGGAV